LKRKKIKDTLQATISQKRDCRRYMLSKETCKKGEKWGGVKAR
jgi:hypothetical protein